MGATSPKREISADDLLDWAEAHIFFARITVTIKLDRNCNSFQAPSSAPPLSFTDNAIAPSARMPVNCEARLHAAVTCKLQVPSWRQISGHTDNNRCYT